MVFIKHCVAGLAALVLSVGVLAAPVEVGGIKIEDVQDVQGSKLALNGGCVR